MNDLRIHHHLCILIYRLGKISTRKCQLFPRNLEKLRENGKVFVHYCIKNHEIWPNKFKGLWWPMNDLRIHHYLFILIYLGEIWTKKSHLCPRSWEKGKVGDVTQRMEFGNTNFRDCGGPWLSDNSPSSLHFDLQVRNFLNWKVLVISMDPCEILHKNYGIWPQIFGIVVVHDWSEN